MECLPASDVSNDRFLERLGFIQPHGQPFFGPSTFSSAEPVAAFYKDSLSSPLLFQATSDCQGIQPAGITSGYDCSQANSLPSTDPLADFVSSPYWVGDEVCDLSLPLVQDAPQDSNNSSLDIATPTLENIYWQPSSDLESLPSSVAVQIPFPDFPSPLRLDALNPDPALMGFSDRQQGSDFVQHYSGVSQQCSALSRQCSDYSSHESAHDSQSDVSMQHDDLSSEYTDSERVSMDDELYALHFTQQPAWSSKPSQMDSAGFRASLPCTCGAALHAAAADPHHQLSASNLAGSDFERCGSSTPITACLSPSTRPPTILKFKPGPLHRPRFEPKKTSRVQRSLKLQASPGKPPSASHTRGPARPNRSARPAAASDDEADWEEERRPRTDRGDKNKRRKQHNPWTLAETAVLVDGVEQCGGGKWADIKKLGFPEIEARSAVDLKDKWRNLLRIALYQSSTVRSKTDKRKEIPKELLQRVRRLVATNFEKTSALKHPKFRRAAKLA